MSAAPRSILIDDVVLWDGHTLHEEGAILTAGEHIVAVGHRDEVHAAVPPSHETRRYAGDRRLALPGMVNFHHHLYSALAAGLVPKGPTDHFQHVLRHLWWPLDAAHTEESVYLSALHGLIEAVKHGVTTVFDHHASMTYPHGSLATTARAVAAVGVRGVLCFECSERGQITRHIEENLTFAADHATDPMIRGMFGMHANLTLGDASLKRIAEAKPAHLPIHIHVGEAPEDLAFCRDHGTDGPVDRLNRYRLVTPESFLIHCLHLSPRDRAVLAEIAPVVVTNPQSNANNGVGTFTPVEGHDYLLGSDGMTGDMIATLRYHYLDLQRRHLPTAHLMGVWNRAPQRVAGRFFPGCGALTPGGPADIAVLDYRPLTLPHRSGSDLPSHLIFGAKRGTAWLTIAAGRPLYHAGTLTTLDESALHQPLRNAARSLHGRFYG